MYFTQKLKFMVSLIDALSQTKLTCVKILLILYSCILGILRFQIKFVDNIYNYMLKVPSACG